MIDEGQFEYKNNNFNFKSRKLIYDILNNFQNTFF